MQHFGDGICLFEFSNMIHKIIIEVVFNVESTLFSALSPACVENRNLLFCLSCFFFLI